MTEIQTAVYVHSEFGRLQLHFQNGVLVQVDLPFKPAFQGQLVALPSEWQHKLDAYFTGQLRDFDCPNVIPSTVIIITRVKINLFFIFLCLKC